MTELHALVFSSHATLELTPFQLEELLLAKRFRNRETDVTDVLLYHDGSFMQSLEGPKSAVHETFARIKRDARHNGVTVLIDAPIEERCCHEWHMGCSDRFMSDLVVQSTARWEMTYLKGGRRGAVAIVLRSFWGHARRWG